jgi:hypothetical protein
MTYEERCAAARRALMEAEESVLQALASARVTVTALEEETRQLSETATRQHMEIYTEQQFAKLMQVSLTTIRRARKRGVIEPIFVEGIIRYTTLHLMQAPEIFRPQKTKLRRVK